MTITRALLAGGLAFCLWPTSVQAGRVAMQKVPFVSTADNPLTAPANATVGWSFRPKRNLRVTHLGFYDFGADGLLGGHVVSIWDGETGQVVAQATIDPGSSPLLQWSYRYEDIEPVLLQGRRRYVIGATVAHVPTFQGPSVDVYPVEDVTTAKPLDQIQQARVNALSLNLLSLNPGGSSLAPGDPILPASKWEGMTTLAPNFKFETPPMTGAEAIPEPASATTALLAAGLLATRRRRARRLPA